MRALLDKELTSRTHGSARDLAARIGRTEQAVSKMRTGKQKITIEDWFRMGEYFGWSTQTIMDTAGIPTAEPDPIPGGVAAVLELIQERLTELGERIAALERRVDPPASPRAPRARSRSPRS